MSVQIRRWVRAEPHRADYQRTRATLDNESNVTYVVHIR